MTTYEVTPVAQVATARTDPQQSDHWGAVVSTITVDGSFPEDCLGGLEGFSHAEIVYVFDRFEEPTEYRLRAPRGRADLPAVGVFADRGPRRPNRIGVSVCRIVSVRGRRLTLRGLDAIDGTPVLDIKPVMRPHLPAPGDVVQPAWVDALLAEYHLP